VRYTMKTVYELVEKGDYEEAINQLELLEEKVVNPNILVLKGICLQLANDELNYSLSDIEEIFKEAYQIDKECIDALIELAWFNLNVNDDAQTAMTLFEKAFENCQEKISEIVIGIAKCMIETKSPEKGMRYLNEISKNIINVKKIETFKKEIVEGIQ
jgi:lipopolysaccharide biosynthesis regulator YciM